MTKEGLLTMSLTPSPRPIPCTRVVFPTPKVPRSRSTSPARAEAPSSTPSARVSSSLPVSMLKTSDIVRHRPVGRGEVLVPGLSEREDRATGVPYSHGWCRVLLLDNFADDRQLGPAGAAQH